MQPGHALTKLKHYLADTASKSCSKAAEAEALLKRCSLDRGGGTLEKQRKNKLAGEARVAGEGRAEGGQKGRKEGVQAYPPANFARRLNCALLKRQVHQIRKESIGLPILLDSQENTLRESLLEERINAKKISCMLTLQDDRPSRKYVVYSRKNLGSE